MPRVLISEFKKEVTDNQKKWYPPDSCVQICCVYDKLREGYNQKFTDKLS